MRSEPILLVEDNPDDVKQTLRAFARNNIGNPVVVARDGEEALDYVFGTGTFAGRDLAVQPGLILLDLNLPRVTGLEVLEQLRGDPRSAHLPVVVLTSSWEEQDMMRSYSLGANVYVRKPVEFNEFLNAARYLGLYWTLLESGLSLLHREPNAPGLPSAPAPPVPSMPLQVLEAEPIGDEQEPVFPHPVRPLRVLVGTGDAGLFRVLGGALGGGGRVVLHSTDARSTFRELLADLPDVVLLDSHLSDISGIEVVRALRNAPRGEDVATVILTRDVAGARMEFGDAAVRIVPKPIDVPALVDLVSGFESRLRDRLLRDRRASTPPALPAAGALKAAPPVACAPEVASAPVPDPFAEAWMLVGLAPGSTAEDVVRSADALLVELAHRARNAYRLEVRAEASASAGRVRAARTELLEHLLAPKR